MENKKRLEQWIFENHDALNLSINKLTWTDQTDLGLHDYSCSISVGGQLFEGRGISKIKDVAILKAVVESIERSICKEHNINSNGVAAHFDLCMAKINAKDELIERDNFLTHYLLGYKGEEIKLLKSFNQYVDFLHINDVTFEMKDISIGETFVQAFITKKSGYSFFGFGSATILKKAQKKAIHESLSNLSSLLFKNKVDSIDIKQFKKLENPTPMVHMHLSRSPKYSGYNNLKNGKFRLQKDLSITCKELTSKIEIFKFLPLHIVKVTSTEIQNLFFGETIADKINFNRLKTVLGTDINFKQINNYPHPIG